MGPRWIRIDKRLTARQAHEENLRSIRSPLTVLHFEDRRKCFAALRGSPPHIVYFLLALIQRHIQRHR